VFKSGPEWPASKGPQAQGIECEACLDQSGVREGRLSDYCSRKSCKIFLAYSKEARCEVLQPADVKLLGRMPRCDTVSHSPDMIFFIYEEDLDLLETTTLLSGHPLSVKLRTV